MLEEECGCDAARMGLTRKPQTGSHNAGEWSELQLDYQVLAAGCGDRS